MSHREAQRFLIRVMYDPAFLIQLRAEPMLLTKAGLTPEERAGILAIDPRALRTDPLRRRRTLRGLLEELKISTTIALAEWRKLSTIEGFFSSQRFHKAISKDASLVLALASFLEDELSQGRLREPALKDVLRYEAACAQSRRAKALCPSLAPIKEKTRVKRADGVFGLRASYDVISIVQQVERYLFELGLMPQVALCDDAPRLSALPTETTPRYLLITPSGGEPALALRLRQN